MRDLLSQPPPVLLPAEPEAEVALAAAVGSPAVDTSGVLPDVALREVAGRYPAYSAAWAALAERALDRGDPVTAYAFARTGYHRGLDQLRRHGWRGAGPVPWSHGPNQGFLRSLASLGRAAGAIGETDEAQRCAQFLDDCDPTAAGALS